MQMNSWSRKLLFILVGTVFLLVFGLQFYFGHLPSNLLSASIGSELEVRDICKVPLAGFKGWKAGVVTALSPVIERNCTKIFEEDQQEVERVRLQNRMWNSTLSDEELLYMTSECSWVVDYFQDNLYLTKLERSFPMAYSFVIYNNPQQTLRLMKYLYRPINTYCIHPDNKSSPIFNGIFRNIAGCLENVIIASKLVDVNWGKPTLMEAQMSCLSDLVRLRPRQPKEKKWRYLINLCGKELPVASTHETVSHLIKLNGSSVMKPRQISPNENTTMKRLHGQEIPFNLQLYKCLAYMALSYEFSHYLVTNTTAIEVYKFFRTCETPEEHFYATLYMIPGVPGGFNPSIPNWHYFYVINAFWLGPPHEDFCTGLKVHKICIVTVGELKKVIVRSSKSLFHNKYFMEEDHTIMDCMEERLVDRNKREYELDC